MVIIIKPKNRVCPLKVANIIGGETEHKNNPVNLALCSEIEDSTWNISGVVYFSIHFKGVNSRWLYMRKEDRDEEYKSILDRL